jgi:hypothetical protein
MAYTTINKGSSYFNPVLYTGTQTQQTINVGFQPDFVWIKSRSNVQVHALFDAVRGVSIGALQSNAGAAENANQKLVAYTSTGFTLPSVNYEWTNTNGWTFASWNWLGANTTVSNTSGTITSTVSANTTAGFSIATYTGNGVSGATVGHGLGVAPKLQMIKKRDGTADWAVVGSFSPLGTLKRIPLNGTGAVGNPSDIYPTLPTSTVFSPGNSGDTNGNGSTYVAYSFAEIKGYSKFGSYTGNGAADGTFVYTGFKPAFIITKITSGVDNWIMYDNKRNTFNPEDLYLLPNGDFAEATFTQYDFVSNGFKFRTSGSQNASGATFIYMAFAENPFVTSGGIPVTAR